MARRERDLKDVELLEAEQAEDLHPAGVRIRVRRPVVVALLAGAAVVAIGVGVALLVNGSHSPVSALDRAQRAADVLPDGLAVGSAASSSRQLASNAGATFWVVRDEQHRYCFVAVLTSPDATAAGSTCANEADLAHGVPLSVGTASSSISAVLVADGTEAPSVAGSWKRISENVFLSSH